MQMSSEQIDIITFIGPKRNCGLDRAVHPRTGFGVWNRGGTSANLLGSCEQGQGRRASVHD